MPNYSKQDAVKKTKRKTTLQRLEGKKRSLVDRQERNGNIYTPSVVISTVTKFLSSVVAIRLAITCNRESFIKERIVQWYPFLRSLPE